MVRPPIVVIAAFFASLPWLAELDETVTLSITAAASVFVVVWGRFVATRMERALDEVQLAGQRFAQAKGAAGGGFVTVLLLLPTPLVDWVTDNLIRMTTGSGETPDRETVYIGDGVRLDAADRDAGAWHRRRQRNLEPPHGRERVR